MSEVKHLQALISKGYNWGCLNCYRAFKNRPIANTEPGKQPYFCSRCQCDIFLDLKSRMKEIKEYNKRMKGKSIILHGKVVSGKGKEG